MFPFTPNITNWTASTGSGGVGPTGPPGPPGTPGPMASSRINTPITLASQILLPADPNPSYIQFELSSGLYDYNNPGGNYSFTTPIAITINTTGYYNVGILFNLVNNNDPGTGFFQVHNLTQGAIGTVPPICSLDISIKSATIPTIPYAFIGTGSSNANCYLEAGSILQVAYIVDINCEVTAPSCIYITKLDGAIGQAVASNQGFSVVYSGPDITLTNTSTLVPFNSADPLYGGFNPLSIFNTSTYEATIQENGIYLLSTNVDYTHNFNTSNQTPVVSIRRGIFNLASASAFYSSTSNDIESIPCSKIVQLNSGDIIGVYLSVPITSVNQTISAIFTQFSCQKLA